LIRGPKHPLLRKASQANKAPPVEERKPDENKLNSLKAEAKGNLVQALDAGTLEDALKKK